MTNEKLLGVRPGTGVIVNGKAAKSQPLVSKDEFSDVRAHIEFVIPKGSNSGVFFQGQYELQIYDSWGVEKGDYAGIECGGIYQQWDEGRMPKGYDGISPKVNASRPAGQWQQFDVIFRGPRFDATGRKIANACFVKVWLNGTLIHDNVELSGPTRGSMHPDDRAAGPILLQGDHGPVAYRNIWIIPLDLDKMGLPNEFFAMDTATIDEHHRTAKEQVEMLKELGYAGIGYWERTPSKGPQGLVKMLSELSDAGLKPFPTYFTVSIDDPNDKSLPLIAESVRAMANRDAVIWLAMTSKSIGNSSQAGDERVVELVSGIADMAQQSGVRIALYPHDRYWLEHMDDAIRIAKKANRRNVGVTFNLYHWLRAEKGKNLDSLVAKAMPYLFAVTINGSSLEGSIETLDKGAFDVCAFLRTLKSAGYTGPIGLQGYGIPGDVYENLRRSMEAWKKCSQQLAIEDAGKL
ncbi:MAG: DUF1080 domain-containing protein [Planctomycetes bacterium]|nr:DUF1080 domain-containing protein [Planctomycetota bacterium]